MKPCLSGKRVVMVRKKQNIKICVHIVENMDSVFNREEVQDFWTEKMVAILRKSGITQADYEKLL